MCLFHVSFQNRFGSDRVPAHDEFTGARKVSPLDRAMRMSGFIRLRRTAAPGAIGICALSLIAAANTSAADDASPWDGDARSAVRLIAGSAGAGKAVRAGVEIRLKSGWHTYYTYPGDARGDATLRLYRVSERQGRRRAVARAAAHSRTRPGHDWIYRRRHPAARGRAG